MSENNNITNINTPKPIYEDGKYKCPNCNSELNNDELASGRCFDCNSYFDFDYTEEKTLHTNFLIRMIKEKNPIFILLVFVLIILIAYFCYKTYYDYSIKRSVMDKFNMTEEEYAEYKNSDDKGSILMEHALNEGELKEYNINSYSGIAITYNLAFKYNSIILSSFSDVADGNITINDFISALNDTKSSLEEHIDNINDFSAIPKNTYFSSYQESVREYVEKSIALYDELLLFSNDGDKNLHTKPITQYVADLDNLDNLTIPTLSQQYLKDIGCNETEITSIMQQWNSFI